MVSVTQEAPFDSKSERKGRKDGGQSHDKSSKEETSKKIETRSEEKEHRPPTTTMSYVVEMQRVEPEIEAKQQDTAKFLEKADKNLSLRGILGQYHNQVLSNSLKRFSTCEILLNTLESTKKLLPMQISLPMKTVFAVRTESASPTRQPSPVAEHRSPIARSPPPRKGRNRSASPEKRRRSRSPPTSPPPKRVSQASSRRLSPDTGRDHSPNRSPQRATHAPHVHPSRDVYYGERPAEEWIRMRSSHTGEIYYFNPKTGASRWDYPNYVRRDYDMRNEKYHPYYPPVSQSNMELSDSYDRKMERGYNYEAPREGFTKVERDNNDYYHGGGTYHHLKTEERTNSQRTTTTGEKRKREEEGSSSGYDRNSSSYDRGSEPRVKHVHEDQELERNYSKKDREEELYQSFPNFYEKMESLKDHSYFNYKEHEMNYNYNYYPRHSSQVLSPTLTGPELYSQYENKSHTSANQRVFVPRPSILICKSCSGKLEHTIPSNFIVEVVNSSVDYCEYCRS